MKTSACLFVNPTDSDTCSENGEEEEGGKSHEEEEIEVTFFSLLLDKLLSIHQARDKAVRYMYTNLTYIMWSLYLFCLVYRFRVCQLVAKMMSYAADAQTKIGPDRLDRVQEVMMQRLYDKVSQYALLFYCAYMYLALSPGPFLVTSW